MDFFVLRVFRLRLRFVRMVVFGGFVGFGVLEAVVNQDFGLLGGLGGGGAQHVAGGFFQGDDVFGLLRGGCLLGGGRGGFGGIVDKGEGDAVVGEGGRGLGFRLGFDFYGEFQLLGLRFGLIAVDDFVARLGFLVLFKLGLPLAFALGLFVNKIGEGGN